MKAVSYAFNYSILLSEAESLYQSIEPNTEQVTITYTNSKISNNPENLKSTIYKKNDTERASYCEESF